MTLCTVSFKKKLNVRFKIQLIVKLAPEAGKEKLSRINGFLKHAFTPKNEYNLQPCIRKYVCA